MHWGLHQIIFALLGAVSPVSTGSFCVLGPKYLSSSAAASSCAMAPSATLLRSTLVTSSVPGLPGLLGLVHGRQPEPERRLLPLQTLLVLQL